MGFHNLVQHAMCTWGSSFILVCFAHFFLEMKRAWGRDERWGWKRQKQEDAKHAMSFTAREGFGIRHNISLVLGGQKEF